MFNGNFMNKVRTSNGAQANSGGKYQTQSYNQYDQASDRGAQDASRVGTTTSNDQQIFNLVNQQRKTPNSNASGNPQQMMMTTQFFNST